MRYRIWIFLPLIALVSACSSGFKTKEIIFYKPSDVNDGFPVAVDIIYPRDREERRALREFADDPGKYFQSDLYESVRKEELDIVDYTRRYQLKHKPDGQEDYVIIAENGKRDADVRSRGNRIPIFFASETTYPRLKKREYIAIEQGFMERVTSRSRRNSYARGYDRRDYSRRRESPARR